MQALNKLHAKTDWRSCDRGLIPEPPLRIFREGVGGALTDGCSQGLIPYVSIS